MQRHLFLHEESKETKHGIDLFKQQHDIISVRKSVRKSGCNYYIENECINTRCETKVYSIVVSIRKEVLNDFIKFVKLHIYIPLKNLCILFCLARRRMPHRL